jgi:hypothetical protein
MIGYHATAVENRSTRRTWGTVTVIEESHHVSCVCGWSDDVRYRHDAVWLADWHQETGKIPTVRPRVQR